MNSMTHADTFPMCALKIMQEAEKEKRVALGGGQELRVFIVDPVQPEQRVQELIEEACRKCPYHPHSQVAD